MTDIRTNEHTTLPSLDPLHADLTFDDVTMLSFAAASVVIAVVLLFLGF